MNLAVTKGYVETSAGQIHFRRAGDGGPWLFLLHQSPFSSRQFERCLPYLGRSARAVAFDSPGYGASDIRNKPSSLRDYAVLLLEAIDNLGAQEFALAGFHTGAGVALELACLAKRRVTKLAVTGVPLLSSDRLEALLKEIVPPQIREDGAHLTDEWSSRYGNWGPDGGLEQVQVAVSEALSVYHRYRWGFEALKGHDPGQLLSALEIPVLFVSSSRDSLRTEDATSMPMCKNARMVDLGAVPPQLPWTAPQEYAAAILEFMAT